MESMNQQVAALTVKDLTENFGGRMPTWEEFLKANSRGRVRANKTVAAQAITWRGIPLAYQLLYGLLTQFASIALPALGVGLWFFGDLNAWWIIAFLAGGLFFFRVSREGHCEAIKVAAHKDEAIYQRLVAMGAFLFSKEDSE